MIPALVTAIIAVFLAYLDGRVKYHSYYLLFAFILLTVFLSLGYYWGSDVENYELWYKNFESSSFLWWDFSQYDIITNKEPGFVCINLLCKPIGYWGMRAVLFVIENTIIYSFIKKHVDKKWYWLAVFVYVFNPNYWVLSSSMMRQWLAMCVVLLGVIFLLRNQYIMFTLLVVLATSFHLTAIICLIILPLSFFQRKATKITIIVFFILLGLYYFLSPLFKDYIALYLKTEDLYMYSTQNKGSFGITSILLMTIYTIVLYYAVKTKQKNSILCWIVMLYGLVLPLLSLGELSSRLSYYFTICTIVTFPLFMGNTLIDKKVRMGVIGTVCLLYFYHFYIFFHGPTWSQSYGTYETLIDKI